MKQGDKVSIKVAEGSGFLKCVWWPKGDVTGLVEKVYKNGKVSVAVDQIKNRSADGRRSLNFKLSDVQVIA